VTMPLPEQLERLRQISIDTLGLSESTQAVLKFYGLIDVPDCIAFFYDAAHNTDAGRPWTRLFGLMFSEVKPALIAAGYWHLVLDAEVWRIFNEQIYEPPRRMIVRWQGQDIDLHEISLEQLGLYDAPLTVRFFNDIGGCINYFLYSLSSNSRYSLKINKYNNHYGESEPGPEFDEYMWGLVQPRLVEMGLWAFVEEHLDDFDFEEARVLVNGWEASKSDPPPIRVRLLRLLFAPILIVVIGLYWIAQAGRTLQRRLRR
jgi:hypothetical protein